MNLASIVLAADTWDWNGHMGGGWWIVMMMGMVVFWGAVIVGIVWLARGSSLGSRTERRESPLEILERRFAEGDISADEYHERRQVMTDGSSIRGGGPSAAAGETNRQGTEVLQ
jgi:putative membrane protein